MVKNKIECIDCGTIIKYDNEIAFNEYDEPICMDCFEKRQVRFDLLFEIHKDKEIGI